MTTLSTERPLTHEEVAVLEQRIDASPRGFARLKEMAGEFVSIAAGLFAVAVVAFLILGLLIKLVTSFNIGTDTPYGFEIAVGLAVLGLGYSLVAVIQTNRPNPQLAQGIQADIDAGIAVVSDYSLAEIKVFQEPEHGGLIYFFLTDDNRVYVSFDYESQEFGVDGQDPTSSTFTPREKLQTIRGSKSGEMIDDVFSGEPLQIPDPKPLTAHAKDWPEPEEFLDAKWSQIDAKYGG